MRDDPVGRSHGSTPIAVEWLPEPHPDDARVAQRYGPEQRGSSSPPSRTPTRPDWTGRSDRHWLTVLIAGDSPSPGACCVEASRARHCGLLVAPGAGVLGAGDRQRCPCSASCWARHRLACAPACGSRARDGGREWRTAFSRAKSQSSTGFESSTRLGRRLRTALCVAESDDRRAVGRCRCSGFFRGRNRADPGVRRVFGRVGRCSRLARARASAARPSRSQRHAPHIAKAPLA